MTRCRTARMCVVLALVVFLASFAVRSPAGDWPQWRGPNRDGISTETNWSIRWPPKQIWRTTIGEGYGSISVSGGRLYVAGKTNDTMDVLYCFDALAGTQIWATAYASGVTEENGYHGHRSTPTVDGNEVYTFSAQGQLRCWDKTTGASNWMVSLPNGRPNWGHASSPLIDGNLVIVNAGANGMAVDKTSRAVVWSSGSTAYTAGYAAPLALTYNSQRSIVVYAYYGVYGRDPVNGQTNWYHTWTDNASYHIADPIPFGSDKLFLTTGYGTGCRLLQLGAGSLSAVWQNANLASHMSTPVIVGDYLYGFHGQQGGGTATYLKCLHVPTGTNVWSRNDLGLDAGTLIAAGDRLIVLGEYGHLGIIQATPSGYDPQGRSFVRVITNQACWTAPAFANGRVYIRSHEGTLACHSIALDANVNGINDEWEEQYFGLGGCSPAEDPDHDGWDNMAEYIAGTNPTNDNGRLDVRIAISNGQVLVTYPTIRTNATGYSGLNRYYNLEDRTNLQLGGWRLVSGATNVVGDNTTKTYTNASPEDMRFFRVNVRLE